MDAHLQTNGFKGTPARDAERLQGSPLTSNDGWRGHPGDTHRPGATPESMGRARDLAISGRSSNCIPETCTRDRTRAGLVVSNPHIASEASPPSPRNTRRQPPDVKVRHAQFPCATRAARPTRPSATPMVGWLACGNSRQRASTMPVQDAVWWAISEAAWLRDARSAHEPGRVRRRTITAHTAYYSDPTNRRRAAITDWATNSENSDARDHHPAG